jgi:exopolyphosphatase/guanosine-5'-triphosphate,3'-diphosphate pyrophosphatase
MRIAILDFGTNTFNLLIADDRENSGLKYLHSSKAPVKLGKGGINNKTLHPDAIERAMSAIELHYQKIREYNAEKIYAFATSAIRDATNRQEFLEKVQQKFDLFVNVIPGDREAELIYKGVRQACNFGGGKVMILDIGGGSNEIIIADKDKIYWQESFNLGIARLLEKFNPENPIHPDTVDKIENYLDLQLNTVLRAMDKFKPVYMVGASGSFETFYALVRNKLPEKYIEKQEESRKPIFLEDYRGLHNILLRSTSEEREKMPGMEPVRVEMIVLASIFVNFILGKWKFEKMMLSEYALKDGVIAEILNI